MLNCNSEIKLARGSTFTMDLTVPSDYDMETAKEIWITFVQRDKEIFTKTKADLTISSDNKVTVVLSQADTLKFATGLAYMQLRAKLQNDSAIVQEPITELSILKILKDGEI